MKMKSRKSRCGGGDGGTGEERVVGRVNLRRSGAAG